MSPPKIFYKMFLMTFFVAGTIFLSLSEKTHALKTPSKQPNDHPIEKRNLCPYKTPEEWKQFLGRYADNKKWTDTCEDNPCDEEYFNFVRENIQDTFEVCSAIIAKNSKVAGCTKNMRNFTTAWLQQHSSDSYGFTVDNGRYLAEQETPDKPKDMMRIPAALVSVLPDLTAVGLAARKNGWKYLTHDSALGGSRTFVVVEDPQGRFDQWMLLNLKTDKSVISGTPMSLITVQKKDSAGNRLKKVRLHFRDYTMVSLGTKGGAKLRGFKLELNVENNGKCYSCHTSGMRQLIARRTPILDSMPVKGELLNAGQYQGVLPQDFSYLRLMELNRKIRSYGGPDWAGMVIPSHHGPALGQAQGCMDCHNGSSRGTLNISTSHAQLKQKLYHELSMPTDTDLPRLLERKEMKNPQLSGDEEITLAKAFEIHDDITKEFEDARFPMLKKWLLETPCL